MCALEDSLGVSTQSSMPQAFNQSVNLGNASHYDVRDGSTGISMWTELVPGSAENCYFVLSNLVVKYGGNVHVGVLIKLEHGTAISWDGRIIRHCTSVTYENGKQNSSVVGNHIFGTFWSTKSDTLGVQMNRRDNIHNT
jgi:hypothetical protein